MEIDAEAYWTGKPSYIDLVGWTAIMRGAPSRALLIVAPQLVTIVVVSRNATKAYGITESRPSHAGPDPGDKKCVRAIDRGPWLT